MGCDREDRDALLLRPVTPEDAIGARGSVLGVCLKDCAVRIERMRKARILVGVEARVARVLTEEGNRVYNLVVEALLLA